MSPHRVLLTVTLITGACVSLLWSQTGLPPADAPMTSILEWRIAAAVFAKPEVESLLLAQLANESCEGQLGGYDFGPTRVYAGQLRFPTTTGLDVVYSCSGSSPNPYIDGWKYRDVSGAVGSASNLYVADPTSFWFLRHVLEAEPPEILNRLRAGDSVNSIAVAPSIAPVRTLLGGPGQYELRLRMRSRSGVNYFLTVSGSSLGSGRFGSLRVQ